MHQVLRCGSADSAPTRCAVHQNTCPARLVAPFPGFESLPWQKLRG
jgi:hypothetical protein